MTLTIRNYLVLVFGVVFLAIGLLGLVQNPVLGLFEVDTVHNLIHIISGLAALASFRYEDASRTYATVMTFVYGLVAIMGYVSTDGTILNLFRANDADDLLHVFLTAGLAFTAFMPESVSKRTLDTRNV